MGLTSGPTFFYFSICHLHVGPKSWSARDARRERREQVRRVVVARSIATYRPRRFQVPTSCRRRPARVHSPYTRNRSSEDFPHGHSAQPRGGPTMLLRRPVASASARPARRAMPSSTSPRDAGGRCRCAPVRNVRHLSCPCATTQAPTTVHRTRQSIGDGDQTSTHCARIDQLANVHSKFIY